MLIAEHRSKPVDSAADGLQRFLLLSGEAQRCGEVYLAGKGVRMRSPTQPLVLREHLLYFRRRLREPLQGQQVRCVTQAAGQRIAA